MFVGGSRIQEGKNLMGFVEMVAPYKDHHWHYLRDLIIHLNTLCN